MQSRLIASSRIMIVTHELFYGAAHALRDYLVGRKTREVVFISHPIRRENPRSYKQVFQKGKLAKEKTIPRMSGNVLGYMIDVCMTFFWVLGEQGVYDVYVGIDPLNCAVGLFLKALRLVRSVVFYSIDFVPKRFPNPLLNALYHAVEVLCVRLADERWDVSPQIAQGRETFLGLRVETFPGRVVPIGVWEKDIARERPRFHPHRFVFAGHLLPK